MASILRVGEAAATNQQPSPHALERACWLNQVVWSHKHLQPTLQLDYLDRKILIRCIAEGIKAQVTCSSWEGAPEQAADSLHLRKQTRTRRTKGLAFEPWKSWSQCCLQSLATWISGRFFVQLQLRDSRGFLRGVIRRIAGMLHHEGVSEN